jgi:hypothetical protein
MPIFELESGGKVYELDAPDMNAALAAFKKYSATSEQPDFATGNEYAPAPASLSPMQRMASDFAGVLPAASQRAVPHVDRHQQNLLSSEVHEDDAGNILFRDHTGQLVPTDSSKHIVLRDPADGNRPKVYARTPETTESPAVGIARTLAPGLASGSPIAPAVGAARPVAQQLAKPGELAVRAGENLANVGGGGAVPIPKFVASDSMMTQAAAGGLRNVPFAGNPIVGAAENTLSRLGQKATDVAQEYGSGSVKVAGDEAGGAIRDWIKSGMGALSSKFYERVDPLIDNSVRTDLATTRSAAQSILSRRANAAITEPSQAVKRIEDAVTTPGGLNYQGVKDLRTYIGDLTPQELAVQGVAPKEVQAIYKALSEDLRKSVLNSGGTKALAAWERANTAHRLLSERSASLAKIVGIRGDVPPEKVFENLVSMATTSSRADITRLLQARKVMGKDAWNELASAVIVRLGEKPGDVGARISSAATTEFSPQKFLTEYGKLSAEGRAVLFRSAGKESIAPYLDDIATISERFRQGQKFANPSGTARASGWMGLGAVAWAEPLTTFASIVGGAIAARSLSSPATIASLAQWTRRYETAAFNPTPGNIALLTRASNNLANTVNSQFGASVSPQDFLRALQGPSRVAADDKQK